jgi:hypothetical protein
MNLKQTLAIKPGALALMALMAATRFDHMGTAIALPDASLAVFFLAGLWLGGRYLFAALLIEAAGVDYWAINQMAVSDFCISPAYLFLIPTYGAMWLAGKYCRGLQGLSIRHVAQQLMALVVATSGAFVISNGSFYLLSDKITQPSWAQYSADFSTYYMAYLSSTVVYAVLILIAVTSVKMLLADKSKQFKI